MALFVYESLSALKPIHKLVSEAGTAIDDNARALFNREIPEVWAGRAALAQALWRARES
jgi:hypothetical protein